jgi:membrane protein
VILGGAATSLLFTAGKLLLGLYLGKVSFESTYGAAASIVVPIVWIYYSGQIFFMGAEFTKTFANRYGSQPSRQQQATIDDIASGSSTSLSETKSIASFRS